MDESCERTRQLNSKFFHDHRCCCRCWFLPYQKPTHPGGSQCVFSFKSYAASYLIQWLQLKLSCHFQHSTLKQRVGGGRTNGVRTQITQHGNHDSSIFTVVVIVIIWLFSVHVRPCMLLLFACLLACLPLFYSNKCTAAQRISGLCLYLCLSLSISFSTPCRHQISIMTMKKVTKCFWWNEKKEIHTKFHCIRLFDYFLPLLLLLLLLAVAAVLLPVGLLFLFHSFFHDSLQVFNRLFFIMLPIVVFTFSFGYLCSGLLVLFSPLSLTPPLSSSFLDIIFD